MGLWLSLQLRGLRGTVTVTVTVLAGDACGVSRGPARSLAMSATQPGDLLWFALCERRPLVCCVPKSA
jgi:hypothetical protein